MWFLQWRAKSGVTEWFTAHQCKSQGTIQLMMDKMKRRFPNWQWQIVYRD